jgi:glycine betaine/choline ABC-type transport system substrate-binding protein
MITYQKVDIASSAALVILFAQAAERASRAAKRIKISAGNATEKSILC